MAASGLSLGGARRCCAAPVAEKEEWKEGDKRQLRQWSSFFLSESVVSVNLAAAIFFASFLPSLHIILSRPPFVSCRWRTLTHYSGNLEAGDCV